MNQAEADAIVAKAIENLPEHVELIYIAYDDQLGDDDLDKLLQAKTADEILDVENEVRDRAYEWDAPAVADHACSVLGPILQQWNEDHEDDPGDNSDDDWDNERFESQWPDEYEGLVEAIRERDQSDPFSDLLRHTPAQLVRFTLNGSSFDENSSDTDLRMLCGLLHVDSSAYLPVLRNWAGDYTSEISIMWYAKVDDIVGAMMQREFEDPDRILDPMLKWKHVSVFCDEQSEEDFVGVSVMLGDGSFCLERNGDWSASYFKSQHSIVSMFEDYRQRLVDFYKYRAKIMGAA